MKLFILASSLFLLCSTTLAADISVVNNCPSTIWIKPDAQAVTGAISAIAPQATWIAPLAGMANAYKLASNNQVANPIQYDYSVDVTGTVYYDISDIPGHPFDLVASANGCPAVSCPGQYCRKTEACPAVNSFTVKACP